MGVAKFVKLNSFLLGDSYQCLYENYEYQVEGGWGVGGDTIHPPGSAPGII